MRLQPHSDMRPARICFYGRFGQGNLGNESTLQAVLHHTRRYFPEGELLCICADPEDTSSRHHVEATPNRYLRTDDLKPRPTSGSRLVRWLRRAALKIPRELLEWVAAFKTLKGKDMLIVPGTGFLTDALSSPLGWPYDIFRWSLIAKLCRCKVLYVGVGAGPIYRPLSRWFIRSALALADFRSYRDNSTREYLRGIGFSRPGDRVCPDLAFSLPPAALPNGSVQKNRGPVVGIGLMNSPARLSTDKPNPAIHRAYLAKLAIFARWLLAHDYDVRLLIGDFVYDAAVMKEFSALLKHEMSSDSEGRIFDVPARSVDELLSHIAATELGVATRFHNALLALILDKPVISLSFHHKSVSLMNGMGLSEYSRDIGNMDVDWLIQQVGKLETNATPLRSLMRQRTEEYRTVLEEQYGVIFGHLGAESHWSQLVRAGPPTA